MEVERRRERDKEAEIRREGEGDRGRATERGERWRVGGREGENETNE